MVLFWLEMDAESSSIGSNCKKIRIMGYFRIFLPERYSIFLIYLSTLRCCKSELANCIFKSIGLDGTETIINNFENGTFLIQVGGYTTPFVVLGSALFTTAVMTIFILPVHSNSNQTNPNTVGEW